MIYPNNRDIKDRTGLLFGYIQERLQRPHHLVDIFGKLYKDKLTEPPHQPSNNDVTKAPYPHKGLQPPPPNLRYNKENINQGQYIHRSDTTMEPRLSHILGNNNEDI